LLSDGLPIFVRHPTETPARTARQVRQEPKQQ
jgi:hypothetical protein